MVRTRGAISDCWINYFLQEGKGREVVKALCRQKRFSTGPSGNVLCSRRKIKDVCRNKDMRRRIRGGT